MLHPEKNLNWKDGKCEAVNRRRLNFTLLNINNTNLPADSGIESSFSKSSSESQILLDYEAQSPTKYEAENSKLDFSFLCANNNTDSQADSGIESIFSKSFSESKMKLINEAEFVTDENCNITCIINNASKSTLIQPSKYICRDHALEKNLKSYQYSLLTDQTETFESYVITSDIKKELKNTKLDLLYELDIRNCTGIISDILSYLSDEDLRLVANVSKHWQDIISNDTKANKRRIVYLKNKKNAAFGPNKVRIMHYY